jgi:hypothetical protein
MNLFDGSRDQERKAKPARPQEFAMTTNLVLFLVCAPMGLLVAIGAAIFAAALLPLASAVRGAAFA